MELKEIEVNECEIQKEGGTYIVRYGNEVVYHDWYSEKYDWLGCAFSALSAMDKKFWNLDTLVTLRHALREDYAQGWNIQDDMIWTFIDENKKLTKKQYNMFISMARVNDKKHHGCYTF